MSYLLMNLELKKLGDYENCQCELSEKQFLTIFSIDKSTLLSRPKYYLDNIFDGIPQKFANQFYFDENQKRVSALAKMLHSLCLHYIDVDVKFLELADFFRNACVKEKE